jgi:hypothetical protein
MRSKPVLTVRAAASRARKFATRLACVALVFGSTSSAHVRGVPQEAQAPSSYALIDQALAAGRINEETAFKYRVFAAFGDTRLPEQYRGDDGGLEFPASVLLGGRRLQTFSAQTQADLAPFFMPPGEPGSWVTLPTVYPDASPARDDDEQTARGAHGPSSSLAEAGTGAREVEWDTVQAVGGEVKVWAQRRYAGDLAKAQAIARELTSTIWPELVRLFWEPLTDEYSNYSSGGPALDIFLVRPTDRDTTRLRHNWNLTGADWRGAAPWSSRYECDEAAVFLLIKSDGPLGSATSPGMLQVVAHELTHAITARMPLQRDCEHYRWINEATATWAEHWVYPNAQSEHRRAKLFHVEKRRSLDRVDSDRDMYPYGSYLFPLHIMLSGRRERALPEMWRQFEHHGMRAGINAALKTVGTTLDSIYPLFAVQNLNRATANDYRRIDDLPDSPEVRPDSFAVSLRGAPVYEKEIFLGIPYLSTKYVHFGFDASVRTVTFDNTLVPIPYASVWAVEKIKGTWQQPADWTKQHGRTWCRDVPAEDLEELVIVFTNNEWQDTNRKLDPGRHRPVLRGHVTGCVGWTGTSDMTNTIVSSDPALTIVETVRSTMRFEVDPALVVRARPAEQWKVVAGQVSWNVTVTGVCTGSASGGFTITDRGGGEEIATLRIWEDGGRLHHSGGSGPWPGDIPSYTVTCPAATNPAERTPTMMLMAALGWFATDGDRDQVAADGKSFSGDFTSSPAPGAITVRHRYSFRCATGC